MSIQSTTKTPVCSLDQSPFVPNHKQSFVGRWVAMILAGQQATIDASYNYCKKDWTAQTGRPSEEASEDFMKACVESHVAFLNCLRFSRMN